LMPIAAGCDVRTSQFTYRIGLKYSDSYIKFVSFLSPVYIVMYNSHKLLKLVLF